MSLVRLLGFATLPCGCVVGRYREVGTNREVAYVEKKGRTGTNREVAYVEEKGRTCDTHGHRRNHTVPAERVAPVALFPAVAKAS
jgi:hypothetical protein